MIIDEMVSKECNQLEIDRSEYRFSRRQVREYCGWGNTQVKIHFKRLEEMEYLIVHRGKRGLTFEYELLYDGNGKDGSRFIMGLIDVDQLLCHQKQISQYQYQHNHNYDDNKSGLKGQNNKYDTNKSGVLSKKSVPGQGQVGAKSGGGRSGLIPLVNRVLPLFLDKTQKKGI